MKLLKKRWFAILVAVVMIVAALTISQSRTHSTTDYQPESASAAWRWGEEHAGAYEKFLSDGAGLFSSGALEDMAAENGALDYRFGTILGVATVNSVSGDMGTVAYNVSDQLGLGESDFLLLLDAQAEDWYLVYGTEVSPYVDNELEIIFRGAMDQMFTQPDRQMKALFADLQDWCAKNLPLAQEEGRHTSVLSTIGEILFILIVLVVLVVAAVAASAMRFGRRVFFGFRPWGFGGFWRGPGYWHRPPPPPGSHRDPPHRPGGFGGRGGFGGGSRGGFGGSSRGGGSHGGGFGGSSR